MSGRIVYGDDIESIIIAKLIAATGTDNIEMVHVKDAAAEMQSKNEKRLTQLLTMDNKNDLEAIKQADWDRHEVDMASTNQPGIRKKAIRIRNNKPTNYTAPKKKRKR